MRKKKPLGKSKLRWKNNIEMDLKYGMSVGWIHLSQNRDRY
jgi:hypothetical protein